MTAVSQITQKRLANELKMLQKDPLELIDTYPDEKDNLVWYFLVKGPDDTDYKGGYYIGKLLHNPEYPIKAPDYMMFTPSGRFEINKKICLTNSGYHSESWSAIWNMRTMLGAFGSIMADDTTSGLSHIKQSPSERQQKAKDSVSYNVKHHKDIFIKFERFVNPDGTVKTDDDLKKESDEAKEKKEKKEKKKKEKAEKGSMSIDK